MPEDQIPIGSCPQWLHCLSVWTRARQDSYAKLLCQSNLMEQLRATMPDDNLNGPIYSLYGDLAYPQSLYLLGGYRNVVNGTDEAQFN